MTRLACMEIISAVVAHRDIFISKCRIPLRTLIFIINSQGISPINIITVSWPWRGPSHPHKIVKIFHFREKCFGQIWLLGGQLVWWARSSKVKVKFWATLIYAPVYCMDEEWQGSSECVCRSWGCHQGLHAVQRHLVWWPYHQCLASSCWGPTSSTSKFWISRKRCHFTFKDYKHMDTDSLWSDVNNQPLLGVIRKQGECPFWHKSSEVRYI